MGDDSGGFRLDAVDLRNVVLRSSYCDKLNNFNFAHINPGSIVRHIDEIRSIVKDVPLHTLGVSETWFQGDKHNDKAFEIPGYKLIRKDRTRESDRSRRGGVGLYLRTDLKVNYVKKSSASSLVDFIFVEIENSMKDKIIVGVVYCPPKLDCMSKLKNILSDSLSRYSNFILLGDFNYDLLSVGRRVVNFRNFFSENCLYTASNEVQIFRGRVPLY